MHSVEEATRIILDQCRPLPPEFTPLTSSALGRVLAEDITSDIDMPPFDKSLMDGYAVRWDDLTPTGVTLSVTHEIHAGQTPAHSISPGQAARIMTGAPIPTGADTVIRKEDTRGEGDRVTVAVCPTRKGANILTKAREMRHGETVLTKGTAIRPIEFGLLATVGRTAVRAFPAPAVSILATGDELVEANQTPGPGQLRNSNGPMLVAQATRAGALPRYLGIAGDRPDSLRLLVAEGLGANVLILSGGVSAGNLDLVPVILRELGVKELLHKVAMKPGKPLLFGIRNSTLVFGLPGNPVSSFVGFELFVRPALRTLSGHQQPGPAWQLLPLAEAFDHSSDRPTYHPAKVEVTATGTRVRMVEWFGSPDLRGLAAADALVALPSGKISLTGGDPLPVVRIE
jgi:molybdopterin molybdotransferase